MRNSQVEFLFESYVLDKWLDHLQDSLKIAFTTKKQKTSNCFFGTVRRWFQDSCNVSTRKKAMIVLYKNISQSFYKKMSRKISYRSRCNMHGDAMGYQQINHFQNLQAMQNPQFHWWLAAWLTKPYQNIQCMVYLSTFTIKINQM